MKKGQIGMFNKIDDNPSSEGQMSLPISNRVPKYLIETNVDTKVDVIENVETVVEEDTQSQLLNIRS